MSVLTRRALLLGAAGAGAAATLAACSRAGGSAPDPAALAGQVAKAEAARPTTGQTRRLRLTAQPTQIDLGGRVVTTWAYGNTVPGPMLRATAGDRVQVEVSNGLPEETTVHWHGLALRNDMDGVPGLTTPAITAGAMFEYDFVVPDAGTHWFHPHHGMQLDRGLYAPFIIDARDEPGDYDLEWVVVLDDWTDGVGKTPEQLLADLVAAGRDGNGMGHMGGWAWAAWAGWTAATSTTRSTSSTGTPPEDPDVLTGEPGQRVRLRIINAASDTIFDVALDGHTRQRHPHRRVPGEPRPGVGDPPRDGRAVRRHPHPRRRRVPPRRPTGRQDRARPRAGAHRVRDGPCGHVPAARARRVSADRRRTHRRPRRRAARRRLGRQPGRRARAGRWRRTCGRSTAAPTTRRSRCR